MVFGQHEGEAQPEWAGLSVVVYPEQLHPKKEPSVLVTPVVERRRRVALSRPSPCRPAPIATTALAFIASLDTDGVMEVTL